MSFFFFKQKTAYEMRIRDWSSDVCSSDLEEGAALAPKFDADGLIPAVAADATDGTVLMLAWMNAAALAATIETGEAHYWSRSRREMWRTLGKGSRRERMCKYVEFLEVAVTIKKNKNSKNKKQQNKK